MNLRTIVDESETPKPSPLFQLQAAVVTNGAWPLDSHVTQQIFSIAGVENLPNISFTSRLFNRNANALAKRILIEKYKINCGSLPNSSPIPLLCKVIPYYDVLERPISTASTYNGVRPVTDNTYLVRPNYAVISVCMKRDNQPCIVATFARLTGENTEHDNKFYDNYTAHQFIVDIDHNQHLSVKRIDDNEFKLVIKDKNLQGFDGMFVGKDVVWSGCFGGESFNSFFDTLLQILFEQKQITFQELINRMPSTNGLFPDNIIEQINSGLNPNNKKGCQIL